jgi:hypothetical protein
MRLAELAGMILCRVIPGIWTGKAISHERIMPAMPGQGCRNQERHLESIRFLKRDFGPDSPRAGHGQPRRRVE